MSKQLNSYLWVEKFRPESVKDAILPETLRTYFTKLVADKEIPNILLHSNSPGTGKSSIAKAICNDIDCNTMYINMSSEGGIDTLRTQIKKFASTKSINNKPKVVICDEFDGSSPALQAGMRAFAEEFHKSCRFILTCNYLNKIIEPIRSRFQIVEFDFTNKAAEQEMKPKILKRIKGILGFEKVEYEESTIVKLVDTFYPDMRRMISLIQQFSKTGAKIDDTIFDVQSVNEELYQLIMDRKITDARRYMLERNYNYGEMYRDFFDNFIPLIEKEKQGQCILIIADYMDRHSRSIDPEINFIACLLEIVAIL